MGSLYAREMNRALGPWSSARSSSSVRPLALFAVVLLSGCLGAPGSEGDAGASSGAPADDAGETPWDAGPADEEEGGEPIEGGTRDGGAVDGGEEPSFADVRLATGLRIRDVAVFQTLKIPLVAAGALRPDTSRTVPLLPHRPTVFRVYLDEIPPADLAYEAIFQIHVDGEVVWQGHDRHVLSGGASDDDNPDSLFEAVAPAEAMVADAAWSVALVQADGEAVPEGVPSEARWPPAGGAVALAPVEDPGGLHVVLVPVRYDRDGSGRLPAIDDEQLTIYRDLLQALYPVTEIQFTLHEPLPWSRPLRWNGNFNFGALNLELLDLREAENAAPDVYYFGLVAPNVDFGAYCGSSCVTGQSYTVADDDDGSHRVGSGLGFAGARSAGTLAHELGHMQGLGHAPCGVSGSAGYPYAGGSIGVWGYDLRDGTFYNPEIAHDFMGYCDQTWISDYHYRKLYERLLLVQGAAALAP